jgi:hypothetical protein
MSICKMTRPQPFPELAGERLGTLTQVKGELGSAVNIVFSQMEAAMAMVMINCPLTSQPVCTGVEVESEASFNSLPEVVGYAHCPLCGNPHEWSKQDAWIAEPSELLREGIPPSAGT